jgi:hypothetical protein
VRLEPAGLFESWARPLHGGSFAALLWSRNESCLAHDDSAVHIDPTPQVFWRDLGFRGSAEVIDLWTGRSLGVHADHWPPIYSVRFYARFVRAPSHLHPFLARVWPHVAQPALERELRPHAHRLVKIVPQKGDSLDWTSEEGEMKA